MRTLCCVLAAATIVACALAVAEVVPEREGPNDPQPPAENAAAAAPQVEPSVPPVVLFDPPWYAYALLVVGVLGILIWLYLRKRWIRLGLIGTVVTGFFVIPGMHLKVEKIGPAQGIDWAISDHDVPAALVALAAIICLTILEWPYSKGDYDSLVHEKAASRAGIMRNAARLVMLQHIGHGVDLETIAREQNMQVADLYAALHCVLEVQALLDRNGE